MEKIKLGIIGCGIAARDLHWPVLQKLKDRFEVVAVCNHTEPKAKSFSEMAGGVPYFLDYHQLLAMPEVEAVDIVLPIELNYQTILDSMKAGKHIIAEKPLAAGLSEGKKLVVRAEKYGKVAMVAENYRYRRVFNEIAGMIQVGMIGKPYSVFWDFFQKIDIKNNKYAQTGWRNHQRYPGGFVTDSGIHNIAALRMIFGKIIPAAAFIRSANPELGRIDSLSLQFKTGEKVRGVFNAFFSSEGYNANRLVIIGKDGTIFFEDGSLTVKNETGTVYSQTFVDDTGYREEFEDFYQSVRNGSETKSPIKEAYQDLKVIIDALELAKN